MLKSCIKSLDNRLQYKKKKNQTIVIVIRQMLFRFTICICAEKGDNNKNEKLPTP